MYEALAAADEARKPPVDRAQKAVDDKVATLLDAGITPFMLLMLETGATAVEIDASLARLAVDASRAVDVQEAAAEMAERAPARAEARAEPDAMPFPTRIGPAPASA